MTDRAQFEAMLEALINEDQEAAKEIFHNIVVAKSREIYEELLESDFQEDGEMPPTETPVAEEEEEEEEVGADDEEGADDEFGGEDDGEETPDFGGEEEGGEGELEDRVMDLEDALEDLKAEFEQLMAGEEGEEPAGDLGGDLGGDELDGDELGGDLGGDELELEDPSMMMEYVNQHGGKTYNTFGKMGDDGANTKSIVAGKNDMGGTTANIAKGGTSTTGGTQGGLLNPKAGDLTSGLGTIHNRKDSKAGKQAFTKKESGKSGDNGQNTNSPINGAPGRAK